MYIYMYIYIYIYCIYRQPSPHSRLSAFPATHALRASRGGFWKRAAASAPLSYHATQRVAYLPHPLLYMNDVQREGGGRKIMYNKRVVVIFRPPPSVLIYFTSKMHVYNT